VANENVTPAGLASGNIFKLRLTVRETNNLIGRNAKLYLEYSTAADFSNSTSTVGEIGSTTALWTYGDGIDQDNDPVLTRLLSDSLATSTHNESALSTSSYVFLPSSIAEWEFTLRANGAATGTAYYFRAVATKQKVGPVLTDSGESYPSLVLGDAAMVSTVSGLAAGTAVAGVTTDIASTPDSMPFGQLAFDVPLSGAQSLYISTNAESGYQLFTKQTSELINNAGYSIAPVSGTNDSPTGWPTEAGTSAFGYHTSDATLSGVWPSRFASNNTYARFESELREVGYSALPVENDRVDLVYRLKTSSQQGAGEYQTSIEYIVVPVY
jgi:hypothetical protein